MVSDPRVAATVRVDTNVFSAALRPNSPLVQLYAEHLTGRRRAITSQTLAEVRYGALRAGWGERRLAAIERLVAQGPVLAPDDETTWTFARLRAACAEDGHPLHQAAHVGDLWVAATAVRHGLTLVAHDRVFQNRPEIDLVTELN